MILFHDFELFLYSQCDNLKDLGVKCLFISDNDGTGTREVYGHPSAVWFAESSQLAAKLFAFLNGEGICRLKLSFHLSCAVMRIDLPHPLGLDFAKCVTQIHRHSSDFVVQVSYLVPVNLFNWYRIIRHVHVWKRFF